MQSPLTRFRGPPRAVATALAALAVAVGATADARAEPPRFLGEVDRNQVTVGEPFVYQVTLSAGNDQISDYRPPDFKGLRVLSTPRAPNQSTQMQFGAAGMFVEVNYSWRYELAALQKGNISIGPARIKVNGQDFKSSVVVVAAGGAGAPPPPPPVSGQPAHGATRGPAQAPTPPPGGAAPGDGGSFIRLVTDKQKAYVGEAISATWCLYMTR